MEEQNWSFTILRLYQKINLELDLDIILLSNVRRREKRKRQLKKENTILILYYELKVDVYVIL